MTRLGVVPLSEAMVHVSIHDVVVWPLLRSKVDLRATRSASMPLALRARAPAPCGEPSNELCPHQAAARRAAAHLAGSAARGRWVGGGRA